MVATPESGDPKPQLIHVGEARRNLHLRSIQRETTQRVHSREGTKLAQEQSELIQHTTHLNSQGDGEQSGDDEDQCDDEDTGRTLGDEDAATEEGGHME